jgi:hypothetical protein
MNDRITGPIAAAIAGALLAVGLVGLGMTLSAGILKYRAQERTV